MEPVEREEIVEMLREELREFIAWTMEELGGEYFLKHPDQPVSSWDEMAAERLVQRIDSQRVNVWERDRYAFFDHPSHASVYEIMKAEDLEIVHYLEEFHCDHYRLADEIEGLSDEGIEQNRLFEDSFGVVLASQMRGWMYRLDVCDVCGLIEVWSMEYDPGEVARHAGDI